MTGAEVGVGVAVTVVGVGTSSGLLTEVIVAGVGLVLVAVTKAPQVVVTVCAVVDIAIVRGKIPDASVEGTDVTGVIGVEEGSTTPAPGGGPAWAIGLAAAGDWSLSCSCCNSSRFC